MVVFLLTGVKYVGRRVSDPTPSFLPGGFLGLVGLQDATQRNEGRLKTDQLERSNWLLPRKSPRLSLRSLLPGPPLPSGQQGAWGAPRDEDSEATRRRTQLEGKRRKRVSTDFAVVRLSPFVKSLRQRPSPRLPDPAQLRFWLSQVTQGW